MLFCRVDEDSWGKQNSGEHSEKRKRQATEDTEPMQEGRAERGLHFFCDKTRCLLLAIIKQDNFMTKNYFDKLSTYGKGSLEPRQRFISFLDCWINISLDKFLDKRIASKFKGRLQKVTHWWKKGTNVQEAHHIVFCQFFGFLREHFLQSKRLLNGSNIISALTNLECPLHWKSRRKESVVAVASSWALLVCLGKDRHQWPSSIHGNSSAESSYVCQIFSTFSSSSTILKSAFSRHFWKSSTVFWSAGSVMFMSQTWKWFCSNDRIVESISV